MLIMWALCPCIAKLYVRSNKTISVTESCLQKAVNNCTWAASSHPRDTVDISDAPCLRDAKDYHLQFPSNE